MGSKRVAPSETWSRYRSYLCCCYCRVPQQYPGYFTTQRPLCTQAKYLICHFRTAVKFVAFAPPGGAYRCPAYRGEVVVSYAEKCVAFAPPGGPFIARCTEVKAVVSYSPPGGPTLPGVPR